MKKVRVILYFISGLITIQGFNVDAQEAKSRSEMLDLIRKEKIDIILPKAMRENNIDMWIIVQKFGRIDPLSEDVGGSYPSDKWSEGEFLGYLVFTDRGNERIERAALGAHGDPDIYDIFGKTEDLKEFVEKRDPKRIGINMSERIGAADGLSYTCYLALVKALGETYASRLVSAEKLVCDFRSQRVASEIVLFGKTGELSRHLMERALSNEVITPGLTTLADVKWWMADQLVSMGLNPEGGMPGVIYPQRNHSEDYIIQRGDLLSMDWGIEMMNFTCDVKRLAYVLREGETDLPPTIKDAFEHGKRVRKIIRKEVKPGSTGIDILEHLYLKIEEAGYQRQEVEDRVSDSPNIEVNVGWHSVGNWVHGVGPAIWTEKPLRREMVLKPTHLMAFEFFIYVPLPEWKGQKLRMGLEDDVIITENGVEWLYPPIERIHLIR
jgi:Xaa-Pro aminopeptidase